MRTCSELVTRWHSARTTITALQAEDSVVFTAISDHGELLDANQCRRLFDLPGAVTGSIDDASVAKDLVTGLSDAERPIFEEPMPGTVDGSTWRSRSWNAGPGTGATV